MTQILIVGAGTVGSSVAQALLEEDNDVTIIDRNNDVLTHIMHNMDLKAIQGDGSDPMVLDEADIENTDLVLAVTDQDDTNIVVCHLAVLLGNTPKVIARLRNIEFHNRKGRLFGREGDSHLIPIDTIISPARLVTDQIMRLIRLPGALQVVEFADGKIQLVAIRADRGGKLVGHKIEELREHMPNVDTRVAAIFRHDSPIIPKGDTVIKPKDEVFFIATPDHISDMMGELRAVDEPIGKRVMLVGAGNIGIGLAQKMAPTELRVKLIENDLERAEKAAAELADTIVIHGNATDQNLMLRENVESTEVFCSVTNNDAVNILSAMMAKKLGARRTMALINNSAYVDLLEETTSGIDIVISPNQNTIGELIRYIRSGSTVAVHSLRRGVAEAVEVVAHGTEKTSRVVGRRIDELKLPKGATVGAILRNNEVLIAHHDLVFEPEDHVILFLADRAPKHIMHVQKLFAPSILYF